MTHHLRLRTAAWNTGTQVAEPPTWRRGRAPAHGTARQFPRPGGTLPSADERPGGLLAASPFNPDVLRHLAWPGALLHVPGLTRCPRSKEEDRQDPDRSARVTAWCWSSTGRSALDHACCFPAPPRLGSTPPPPFEQDGASDARDRRPQFAGAPQVDHHRPLPAYVPPAGRSATGDATTAHPEVRKTRLPQHLLAHATFVVMRSGALAPRPTARDVLDCCRRVVDTETAEAEAAGLRRLMKSLPGHGRVQGMLVKPG